jgi:D-apiose dehydrogenase
MRRYRAGIIGCGFVAEAYHLPVQRSLKEVETVALADVDELALERQAAKFRISRKYTSYLDMIGRENLDFVAACVPPELHLPVTRAAAERGVHVLCEKPMASSPAEVAELVRVVKESKIKFMIAENFWWYPDMVAAKRYIDSNVIGDVFHIRVEEFINDVDPTYRRARDRFLILEQDVHYIDIMRHLARAEVVRVHAVIRKIATQELAGENFASITMEFDNGLVGRIDECWCSAKGEQFVMRMRIDGTKGGIFINALDRPLKIYSEGAGKSGWIYPPTATKPATGHKEGYAAPWPVAELRQGTAGAYEAFVEYLGAGIEPVTTAEDNARTMEVVFAAYASARDHRVIALASAEPGLRDVMGEG